MENQELEIQIISVAENRSELYRWEIMRHDGVAPVEVALTTDFHVDPETRHVTLELGVHYTSVRAQVMRRLMDHVMSVCFAVRPIGGPQTPSLMVTPEIIRMILGVALGASRGMIALRTAGTFLARHPLPLYDLRTLVDNILGAGESFSDSAAR